MADSNDNTPPKPEEAPKSSESDKLQLLHNIFKTIFGSGQELHLQLANQEFKLPLNLWSASVLITLVISVAITYNNSVSSGKFQGSLSSFVLNIEDNETQQEIKSDIIFEFWTPSEKTLASMTEKTYLDVKNRNKLDWYKLPSDKKSTKEHKINPYYDATLAEHPSLSAFGKELMGELGSTGYSYWESRGRGTSGSKVGYSWEATFNDNINIEITAEKFAALYKKHFNRDKKIYLKIFGANVDRVE